MNFKILRKIGYKILAWCFLTVGILFALYLFLLSLINFTVPYLQKYNPEITNRVSDAFAHPIKISSIGVARENLLPVLVLHDVDIFDNVTASNVLWHINELHLWINPWRSLWHWNLEESAIKIKGTTIVLEIKKTQEIRLGDLILRHAADKKAQDADGADAEGSLSYAKDFLKRNKLLADYTQLILEDTTFILQQENGKRPVKFTNIRLKFANSILRHTLAFRAKMLQDNAKGPASFAAKFRFSGNLQQYSAFAIKGSIWIDNLNNVVFALPTMPQAVKGNGKGNGNADIAEKNNSSGQTAEANATVDEAAEFIAKWAKLLPQNVSIKLSVSNSSFWFTNWFNAAIFFNDFDLDINWQNLAQTLKINIADISSELAGLELEGKGALNWLNLRSFKPNVDFTFHFAASQLEKLRNYYPAKIMYPGLVNWLDHAFSSQGDLYGSMILRGNLADFPFVNHNGLFSVDIAADDVDLLFHKLWPSLRRINGQILFSGKTMRIIAKSASIFNVPFYNTIAEISDLTKSVLKIQGTVRADMGIMQRFVAATPLRDRLGKKLAPVNLRGLSMLDLNLVLPLAVKGDAAEVSGKLHLENNRLLMPAWNFELQSLRGVIDFDDYAVSAKDLHGLLFGYDTVLNIATVKNEAAANLSANGEGKVQEGATQITFDGRVPFLVLARHFAISLNSYLQGDFIYHGVLNLPQNPEKNITLDILSDLRDVKINFPPLLAKIVNTASRDFKAHFVFTSDFTAPQIFLQYGDKLNAALAFIKDKEYAKFKSGEICFGGGKASVPSASGLLISGKLDKVEWQEWRQYLFSESEYGVKSAPKTEMPFNSKIISKIDLTIGALNILGQTFTSLHLTAIPSVKNQSWAIKLQNSNISGLLAVPYDMVKNALKIDLQKLYLLDAGKKEKVTLEPQDFPRLQVTINDLRYGGNALGQVILETTPINTGLAVDALKIHAANFELYANGKWENFGDFTRSVMNGKCTSQNVGEALKQLQFTSNLSGGVGGANFSLMWRGAFYRPDVSTMDGNVSVNVNKGRIIHLESSAEAGVGIGRLVSILGLQTLPRRLTLDFSDLVKSGFSFDYLKGTFKLVHGDAFTHDAELDGPVAKVEVRGKIGFSKKNYDMQLKVISHITSSLPVIATVAGGPIVGAATWVADKIIGGEVSRVMAYVYNVKGTWANPDIKIVEKNKNARSTKNSK